MIKLDEEQRNALNKLKEDFEKQNFPLDLKISEDGEFVVFFKKKNNKDMFRKSMRQLIYNLTGRPVKD